MSSSPSGVLSAQQRVWRHWHADGLPVLVAGASFLAIALPFLLMQTHSLGPTSKTIALLLAMVPYAVLLLGQHQIVSWLKTKLTYPRAGSVLDPIDRIAEREHGTILSVNELDAEQRRQRESARRESQWRTLFA